MNKAQALTFEKGKSPKHTAILAMVAQDQGCQCEAYKDWFTYKRWLSQGYQVQKGEKGIRLTTFQAGEKKDPDTGKVKRWSRPWGFTVFCRCQVKERSAK